MRRKKWSARRRWYRVLKQEVQEVLRKEVIMSKVDLTGKELKELHKWFSTMHDEPESEHFILVEMDDLDMGGFVVVFKKIGDLRKYYRARWQYSVPFQGDLVGDVVDICRVEPYRVMQTKYRKVS